MTNRTPAFRRWPARYQSSGLPGPAVQTDAGSVFSTQIELLMREQAALDRRLLRVENSVVFRTLRAIGRYANKAGSYLARGERQDRPSKHLDQWLATHRAAVSAAAPKINTGIPFRVIVPASREQQVAARNTLSSLLQQTYGDWRAHVIGEEAGFASSLTDSRITASSVPEVGAESYVIVLTPGSILDPHALAYIAEAIQVSSPDLLYTDEVCTDPAGRARLLYLKPAWSPALLGNDKYIGSFFAFATERFDLTKIPGLGQADAAGVGGDVMALHIPLVLCARSPIVSFASETPATPVIPSPTTAVTVIICSRTPDLLERCLRGLRHETSYPLMDIVVVIHRTGNGERDAEMARVVASYSGRMLEYEGTFHYSRMNNLAAQLANTEILLFLNDDVWPAGDPHWLSRMVTRLLQPDTGVVGARLLYPDGTIQHAGVVVGLGNAAGHPARGCRSSFTWPWLESTREVSAVTGACLAVKREVFDSIGGFDLQFPVNFNDVDLCLRVWDRGLRVLIAGDAVLFHAECQTRVGFTEYSERARFFLRWAQLFEIGDPYYTPHLTTEDESVTLKF